MTHPDLLDVAPLGSHPPFALLQPASLFDLPAGTDLGELVLADAPQGARTVAARIAPDWAWTLHHGEGWACREGKGPERSNGTRPKLKILEPCRSVWLHAVATDPGFPDVSHHVEIVWVEIIRTGRWKPEFASVGTREPAPVALNRTRHRWWATVPCEVGVTVCKALLSRPPDAAAIAAAIRAAKIKKLEDDHE